uniref:Uncharacterized protein n=1 Tax=Arundo donax TaxID=35708 RepID=A0A0A8ZQ80_ARUDO
MMWNGSIKSTVVIMRG